MRDHPSSKAARMLVGVLVLAAGFVACSATTSSVEPRSPSSGTTSPKKPAPIALPGACVDPVVDARARLGVDADAAGVRREAIDLDLDGAPDSLISHESFCGSGGCAWHLYVARGACSHHVGELFAVLPIAEATQHHGLVDLELTVRKGCAGMARIEQRTQFDGSTYVVERMRTCRCPDDDDDDDHPGDPDPDRFCDEWHDPASPGAP